MRPERTEPSESSPPAHATAGNSTFDGDACDPTSVERVHRGDRGLEGISFGPLLFGGSRIRYPGSLRFPRFSTLVHTEDSWAAGSLSMSLAVVKRTVWPRRVASWAMLSRIVVADAVGSDEDGVDALVDEIEGEHVIDARTLTKGPS